MLAAQSHRGPVGDHNLLGHDLLFLEEMVARMPDYFVSEATRWDMGTQPVIQRHHIGYHVR